MKIAITGHRPNKLGNDYDLKSPLIQEIKREIKDVIYMQHTHGFNDVTGISGMALGIDTLYALICIEMNIPFIAAIPCRGQESMWPNKSKILYYQLCGNKLCTIHHVSEESYTAQCMQKRNEWMVDNCDELTAVWDKSPGGTANCVRYALSKGITPIYINPKELIT